jgi:RNA polymerase sigma-70 factor, ECF subfamily
VLVTCPPVVAASLSVRRDAAFPENRSASMRLDVTDCLIRIRGGDKNAARELASLVYGDLKERAERFVKNSPAAPVSTTTLVHEAYLKMIDGAAPVTGGRVEFMAFAATIMRNLLVDFARQRNARKRGGDLNRICLEAASHKSASKDVDVLGVHEALERLSALDPRMVQIVEMRFFGGMTGDEIAEHLGVTRRTITRELTAAQAWLRKTLEAGPAEGS